jgi:hypothetical protein
MTEQNEVKRVGAAELISAIKKAGASEKVVEFQYPYVTEVFFSLAYASKQLLKGITDEARESFFNTRSRQQEDRINDEKFSRASARQLIKSWRGLTVGRLRKIVVGLEISGDDNQEVLYDEELAFVMMDNSIDLQLWVVNTATDVSNYARIAEVKKEQYQNLES